MELHMPAALASGYRSRSQQARVVTEAWGQRELFCANCESPFLKPTPNNSRAVDLVCPRCAAPFQLKAKRGSIGRIIDDGAYTAMLAAVREDRTPNLVLMRYDWPAWTVVDLLLIPHFAFPESAIVKRKPLAPTARRAGWVGCNIDLSRIAPEAQIPVVTACEPSPPAQVRARYNRLKPLREIKAIHRGWALDVLNVLRQLGRLEFTNDEVYAFDRDLELLHPGNRHIRPKIRQQLQVLRDSRLLIHVGPGRWRLV